MFLSIRHRHPDGRSPDYRASEVPKHMEFQDRLAACSMLFLKVYIAQRNKIPITQGRVLVYV